MRYLKVTIILIISYFNLSAQDSEITEIINRVSLDSLVKHVRILSGEEPYKLGDSTILIRNRSIGEEGNNFAALYLAEKISEFAGTEEIMQYSETGINILAGKLSSPMGLDEFYLICAHYDAVADYCADDNASSCAAILEIARVLSQSAIGGNIFYAFFDEEELGLIGSNVIATLFSTYSYNIKGVVNLEMLGWDGNNDGLFDIHVRDIADTKALGNLIAKTASDYNLNLTPNFIDPGTDRSDHASFWNYDFTATVFGESFFGGDGNPYYHTADDRIDKFNLGYYHELSKLTAGVAATLAKYGLNDVASSSEDVTITDFKLYQNFPNPFNPTTTLRFGLPEESNVKICIYNILGEMITILNDEVMKAGYHEIHFNANSLASGVYLYSIIAESTTSNKNFSKIKKMILLR